MSTKIRVNLTKEIIAKSAYCNIKNEKGELIQKGDNPGITLLDEINIGSNCAIGCAIWDIFPKTWVDSDSIAFYNGINSCNLLVDNYAVTSLPDEAISFITEFDGSTYKERLKMEPISFDIEIPDAVIDKISLDELKESLINHPTLELI